MRILVVFGTRPEAIKLWPVLAALSRAGVRPVVCVTGQHRDLLAQTLPLLGIVPDFDLRLMDAAASPAALADLMAERVAWVIAKVRPDWVVVQGDTTSALAASLAAAVGGVPLAHVEAGLRTFDRSAPWPEEGNRCEIGRLADLHFAPTSRAATNLQAEGVAEDAIVVTGNTAIDALHAMLGRLDAEPDLLRSSLAEADVGVGKRIIVLTGHRRENFGDGFRHVAAAARRIALRGDVDVVMPVHPNPSLGDFVELLRDVPGVRLLPPLSYSACVALLRRAFLIITDSGGLQEEAPALGIPLLVTRASTERPEAIDCGAARLVGTNADAIADAANALLDDPAAYAAMARIRSPFGDGRAAGRIVGRLLASMRSEYLGFTVSGLAFPD